jgi:hypothetical protein
MEKASGRLSFAYKYAPVADPLDNCRIRMCDLGLARLELAILDKRPNKFWITVSDPVYGYR